MSDKGVIEYVNVPMMDNIEFVERGTCDWITKYPNKIKGDGAGVYNGHGQRTEINNWKVATSPFGMWVMQQVIDNLYDPMDGDVAVSFVRNVPQDLKRVVQETVMCIGGVSYYKRGGWWLGLNLITSAWYSDNPECGDVYIELCEGIVNFWNSGVFELNNEKVKVRPLAKVLGTPPLESHPSDLATEILNDI